MTRPVELVIDHRPPPNPEPLMYWILLPLLLLGLLVTAAAMVLRLAFRVRRREEQGDPGELGLEFSVVSVPTAGGRRLFGWWMPGDSGERCVVLMHGWGGNAESMLPLGAPLRRAGLGVLLVDARGHGRSDTDGFSSLPRFAEDVGAAIDWLRREHGLDPDDIALVGHSVGGSAVLLEAFHRPGLAVVVAVAAFAHPGWVMHRQLASMHIPDLVANWIVRYAQWRIGHRLDEIAPLATIGSITAPVLLIHGTGDSTIPISDAYAIQAAAAGREVTLLEVDSGEHRARHLIVGLESRLVSFVRE